MIFNKLKNCIDKNYRYIFALEQTKDKEGKDVIALYSLFFNDRIYINPDVVSKMGIRKFMKEMVRINKSRIAEWVRTKHDHVKQGWEERYSKAIEAHKNNQMVDSEFQEEHTKMLQQSGLSLVIIHSIMD